MGNKFLGPKRAGMNKVSSYECGEKATPGARGPIDVQYYMFVLTFLIFDVEAMFLIPFALRYRTNLVDVSAIVVIGIFVGLILLGYVYELRKRLLSWRALA
ncbi:MAG: NADH-quinone oxidoreductase subunit A [Thermoplasmatota archaeon]